MVIYIVREDLSELDILMGTFSLIYVIISIIIGILFFKRYLETRQKEHLALGIIYILISSGWWGISTAFLSIICLDQDISDKLYIFLGQSFIPFAMISWIYSMSKVLYEKRGKIMVIFSMLIVIPYVVIIIAFILIDPPVFGERTDYFEGITTEIFTISGVLILLVPIITAFHFVFKSLKIANYKVRLRGIFLLIAFLFFTIGIALDSFLTLDSSSIIITRIILILSAILFYWGFFLPRYLENKIDAKRA